MEKRKKERAAVRYKPKQQSLWMEFRKNYFFYLLAIPGIVVLLMFNYIPMAGIYVAFENYTYQGGLFGSEFVGLKNFEFFFKNINNALRATRNTIVINLGSILLGKALQVTVAILLGDVKKNSFRKASQTIILFPYFLSWIVIGALSETILSDKSGMLNQLIVFFGGEAVKWSTQAKYWQPIIIVATIWKGFGYGSILYFATLTGFDQEIYEAAEIDGAGRFKRATKITLPLLKPTIVTLLLLDVGGILKGSLDQIMGMTRLNPLLFETTDTITTFVYRTTTQNGQFGTASAISLYQSVFGCILVLTANLIARKIDPDYALF